MNAEHPNVSVLRAIYADLRTIGRYVSDDVVLHSAEREMPGQIGKYVGAQAVAAKEAELIRLTGGTLVMEVEQIVANDHFGAVTGLLCAEQYGAKIALPFCGLWRFDGGQIVEHWENAYDVTAFAQFLGGDLTGAARAWLQPDSYSPPLPVATRDPSW